MNKLLIRNVNKRVNYIIFKIKMKLIIASIFGRRNIMYAIKRILGKYMVKKIPI